MTTCQEIYGKKESRELFMGIIGFFVGLSLVPMLTEKKKKREFIRVRVS